MIYRKKKTINTKEGVQDLKVLMESIIKKDGPVYIIVGTREFYDDKVAFQIIEFSKQFSPMDKMLIISNVIAEVRDGIEEV